MNDKTLKGLAALTGLGLVGVVGVGAVVGSNSAADDLQPKAYKALSANHLGGIKVDFDGREAKLSNGSAADPAKAKKVVEGIDGVRWAKVAGKSSNGAAVTGKVSGTPSLNLSVTPDGPTISGVVPDAATAARIKAAAAGAFGGTVSGDLTVDPSVSSPDWLTGVPGALGDLRAVKDLTLKVDGTSLTASGSLATQGAVSAAAAALGSKAEGLTLDNLLTVAKAKAVSSSLSAADRATIKNATVYFEGDVDRFVPGTTAKLKALVAVLKAHPDVKVQAGGHSGPGVESFVHALAQSRVDAVRSYLIAKGANGKQIVPKNYGADKGAVVGAQKNRRVDFIVKGN